MSESSGQDEPTGASSERPPDTGNADVDAALALLTQLETLPTAEHVGVYEGIHARLHQALPDLEGG